MKVTSATLAVASMALSPSLLSSPIFAHAAPTAPFGSLSPNPGPVYLTASPQLRGTDSPIVPQGARKIAGRRRSLRRAVSSKFRSDNIVNRDEANPLSALGFGASPVPVPSPENIIPSHGASLNPPLVASAVISSIIPSQTPAPAIAEQTGKVVEVANEAPSQVRDPTGASPPLVVPGNSGILDGASKIVDSANPAIPIVSRSQTKSNLGIVSNLPAVVNDITSAPIDVVHSVPVVGGLVDPVSSLGAPVLESGNQLLDGILPKSATSGLNSVTGLLTPLLTTPIVGPTLETLSSLVPLTSTVRGSVPALPLNSAAQVVPSHSVEVIVPGVPGIGVHPSVPHPANLVSVPGSLPLSAPVEPNVGTPASSGAPSASDLPMPGPEVTIPNSSSVGEQVKAKADPIAPNASDAVPSASLIPQPAASRIPESPAPAPSVPVSPSAAAPSPVQGRSAAAPTPSAAPPTNAPAGDEIPKLVVERVPVASADDGMRLPIGGTGMGRPDGFEPAAARLAFTPPSATSETVPTPTIKPSLTGASDSTRALLPTGTNHMPSPGTLATNGVMTAWRRLVSESGSPTPEATPLVPSGLVYVSPAATTPARLSVSRSPSVITLKSVSMASIRGQDETSAMPTQIYSVVPDAHLAGMAPTLSTDSLDSFSSDSDSSTGLMDPTSASRYPVASSATEQIATYTGGTTLSRVNERSGAKLKGRSRLSKVLRSVITPSPMSASAVANSHGITDTPVMPLPSTSSTSMSSGTRAASPAMATRRIFRWGMPKMVTATFRSVSKPSSK